MAAVLGLAACANDATETASDKTHPQSGAKILSVPQGAIAGCLSVEVTDELAERIETAQAATRSGGGAMTRSGVADMDLVLERIGAERFARVFPTKHATSSGTASSGSTAGIRSVSTARRN